MGSICQGMLAGESQETWLLYWNSPWPLDTLPPKIRMTPNPAGLLEGLEDFDMCLDQGSKLLCFLVMLTRYLLATICI